MTEVDKLIEELFNTWTHLPRKEIPTWLELSKYMFEAGRKYEGNYPCVQWIANTDN